MRVHWRAAAWFLGLLVLAHTADTYIFRGLVSLSPGALTSPYWALEALAATATAVIFLLAGATLASRLGDSRFTISWAATLGIAYVVIVAFQEPRLMYSHAPIWLWVLAWADYYLPPIASALGAVLWQKYRVWRVTRALTA